MHLEYFMNSVGLQPAYRIPVKGRNPMHIKLILATHIVFVFKIGLQNYIH